MGRRLFLTFSFQFARSSYQPFLIVQCKITGVYIGFSINSQIFFLKVVILQEKQHQEKLRLKEMFEKNMSEQRDQLTNMMQANFEEQRKEREATLNQQRTMDNVIDVMKTSLEERNEEIGLLRQEIEAVMNRPTPKEPCIIL